MDVLCYYVCSNSSSLSSEKLRVLSSIPAASNAIPRFFGSSATLRIPSVISSNLRIHSSNVELKKKREIPANNKNLSVKKGVHQNGDPLGRRDLGKAVVKWIRQAMKAMASEFAAAELRGDFKELEERMGPGVTFLIEAQPYLTVVPMPLGLEAVCLKVCAHYPTLLDHFQRELKEVLQGLEKEEVVENWRETQSWKLLKQLAHSGTIFRLFCFCVC